MTEKPNIVLIVADDMGYGDCGCFGSGAIETPNIDALARDGVRFTDFHSNGAVCSPTRAALLTGRYQQRCGIEGVITAASHRHIGMPLTETTFAEILKANGYRTALFGKWHLGYDRKFNPARRGFDEFHGCHRAWGAVHSREPSSSLLSLPGTRMSTLPIPGPR